MKISATSKVLPICCTLVLAFSWAGAGAPAAATNVQLPAQQKQAIADILASLKPEYQADLTFQVLDRTGTAFSEKQKRQMIQMVFDNAVDAVQPYPIRDASHSPLGLTHQVASERYQKMDALDIQTGAARYALGLSPRFAQSLFQSISVTTPHGFSCDARAIPDVSAFYDTADLLIKDGRLPAIAYGESGPVYIESLARTMNAPVEIVPMAKLLVDSRLSARDLQAIVAAFAVAFGSMTATDREMSVMEDSGQLTEAVDSVAGAMKTAGLSDAALIQTYRDFLIRGLDKEQCSDYSVDRKQIAKRFNELVARRFGVDSSVVALLAGEQLAAQKRQEVQPEPKVNIPAEVWPYLRRLVDTYNANMVQKYRSGKPGTIQPETADVEAVMDYVFASETQNSRNRSAIFGAGRRC